MKLSQESMRFIYRTACVIYSGIETKQRQGLLASVEVWGITTGYLANEQHREVVTTNNFREKQPLYDSSFLGKMENMWFCVNGEGPGVPFIHCPLPHALVNCPSHSTTELQAKHQHPPALLITHFLPGKSVSSSPFP